jgi:hypothetical protein
VERDQSNTTLLCHRYICQVAKNAFDKCYTVRLLCYRLIVSDTGKRYGEAIVHCNLFTQHFLLVARHIPFLIQIIANQPTTHPAFRKYNCMI